MRFNLLFGILILVNVGYTQPQTQIVGGWEAGERFPAIFIFSEFRKQLAEQFCTATKVSPDQFLTAAHCVLALGQKRWYVPQTSFAGQQFYYSFGRDLSKPEAVHALTIKKVSLHPLLNNCLQKAKYSPAKCHAGGLPTPDVAIITVEKSHGPFFDAPNLPFDFAPNRAGDEIVIAGYGSTQDGDSKPPVLKYGPTQVASKDELTQAIAGTSAAAMGFMDTGFFFGSLGPLVHKKFPNLGSGDSGGPVIKESPDRIVGINSSAVCADGAASDCEVTSNNFFARIDSEATIPVGQWIRSILHRD